MVSEKTLGFYSVKGFYEAFFQPNRGAKTNLQLAFEVPGPTQIHCFKTLPESPGRPPRHGCHRLLIASLDGQAGHIV